MPAEVSTPEESTAISPAIEDVPATAMDGEHSDGPLPARDASGDKPG